VSEPSPLGEVTEGFVGLARWFATLVGEEAAAMGRRIDAGTFDADAAASSLARWAALPLLGWAAAVNEVADAAAIFRGLRRERDLESDFFEAPERGLPRALLLEGPLTNGFGRTVTTAGKPAEADLIPADWVKIVPPALAAGEANFRFRATAVPPDRIGVYSGKVKVMVEADDPEGVSVHVGDVGVWLVVS
jgi:hypothetical protein